MRQKKLAGLMIMAAIAVTSVAMAAPGVTTAPVVIVQGKATTHDRTPLADVVVEAMPFISMAEPNPDRVVFQPATTRTDSAGVYKLSVAPGKAIVVQVRPPGYPLYTTYVASSLDVTDYPPQTETLEKNIVLPETHTVSGVFRHGDGKPLGHRAITFLPVPPRGPDPNRTIVPGQDVAVSTTTTADGHFTMTNLYPGEWAVVATYDGLAPARSVIQVPTSDPVELRADSQGGTITGMVKHHHSGSPIAGVTVELHHFQDSVVHSGATRKATSDSQGRVHYSHLAPGQYYAIVGPTPSQPWATLGRNPEIVEVSNNRTVEADVFVYDGYGIDARVIDKTTGDPLANKSFTLLELPDTPTVGTPPWKIPVSTDADGRLRLQHLFPSQRIQQSLSLRLIVEDPEYMPDLEMRPLEYLPANRTGMGFYFRQDRNQFTSDIPLIRTVPVKGRVSDSEGKPLAGALVTWTSDRPSAPDYRGAVPLVVSGKDGTFELRTPPNTDVTLRADAPGMASLFSEKLSVGTQAPAAVDLRLMLKSPE